MQPLTLSGGSQDQPTSQGVSKTTKKLSKGKQNGADPFDTIGGTGSFASIMKQKGMVFSIQKGDTVKEGFVSCQAELTIGKDEIKEPLAGVKVGRGYLSRKGTKEMNGDAIAFQDHVLFEKNMKLNPEGLASGGVSEAKKTGKELLGKLGKTQSPMGEGNIDKGDALNLQDESPGHGSESSQIRSVIEKESTLSLKKGISGFGKVEKSPSADTMLSDDPARDLGVLSADGLKSNKLAKKNVSEGMRISRSGDGIEDHKEDGEREISKDLDTKGISSMKGSSDPKGQEILLKSEQQKLESVKENSISTGRLNEASEEMQNNKNLFSDGLKSERSVEIGGAGKNDTSLWMTQTDYSGVKGIWNASGTNINGDSAPLQFQDIMGQIEDGAANMLKRSSGRIVITLEPPNLGTLNMDVRVHNDVVRMILIADNNDVKQVLHTNLDQLKTALQGQGLNIDRFEVLVQERSFEGNPGFQPGGGALFEEGRGRRDNTKEDNSPIQMLASGRNELNDPSLGVISLFA